MKKLLYIGNKLENDRSNLSSIHVLGALLELEGYKVAYASHYQNKVLRLVHMIYKTIISCTKVDVVLIDAYSTHNFYFALIISQLCRFLRLPYIPNLNGGNLPMRLKSNPRLSDLIFDNAQCNVAPSKYLKERFEAYGYNNLKYIPNTIEINNYPFIRRTYDSPRLLWVRSFAKIYNPLLAVRVLKALKDLGFDASLCMVGPDSDGSLQEVKALSEALRVKVNFTGKLTKAEWIERSKAFNVFINTTNIDNTPVSVIEAMALGLPVVSTNVGGMPYLIAQGENGVLVERDNVEAMVKAILRLMNEEDKRDKLIINARKLAESFDWERVKYAWKKILD